MTNRLRRIHLQDLFVAHAYDNGLTAVETCGVDANFLTGEQPAHGQRFEPSLAVPFLFAIHTHAILGRQVGEGREGVNVIRVLADPAAGGGLGRLGLKLQRVVRLDAEHLRQARVMRCHAGLDGMPDDGRVGPLHLLRFNHSHAPRDVFGDTVAHRHKPISRGQLDRRYRKMVEAYEA